MDRSMGSLSLSLPVRWVLLAVLVALAGGCQVGPAPVSNRTLIAHLPGVDFAGLKTMEHVDSVNVSMSIPDKWTPIKTQRTPLFTNQQWKSPGGYTGVGVVYVHLPFPLSANTLLWLAKVEYSKKSPSGKALNSWTDSLGRPWFEAENEKYHIRGYALTDGLNGWIVYEGYNHTRPLDVAELVVAGQSIDTAIPMVTSNNSAPPKTATAEASEK